LLTQAGGAQVAPTGKWLVRWNGQDELARN
jgi:hypothetical protein